MNTSVSECRALNQSNRNKFRFGDDRDALLSVVDHTPPVDAVVGIGSADRAFGRTLEVLHAEADPLVRQRDRTLLSVPAVLPSQLTSAREMFASQISDLIKPLMSNFKRWRAFQVVHR
jgi:hypothetical protein